ncbi:MAG: exodeoxyribonuclease VII small subunit [bacterium]
MEENNKNNAVEPRNFEEALERLEKLVEALESGKLTLDETVNYFKEALSIANWCYKKLQIIEEEIKILVEKEGKFELENFKLPED